MLLLGCLVAVGPEQDAEAGFLSEPARGLPSGADADPEADGRTGVSDAS